MCLQSSFKEASNVQRGVTHHCGERRFNNRNLQMHRRATRLHCDVVKFKNVYTNLNGICAQCQKFETEMKHFHGV